jgi:hypothetical protein
MELPAGERSVFSRQAIHDLEVLRAWFSICLKVNRNWTKLRSRRALRMWESTMGVSP